MPSSKFLLPVTQKEKIFKHNMQSYKSYTTFLTLHAHRLKSKPLLNVEGGGEGHVYINSRGLLGLYNNKIIFFKIGFVKVEKPFFKI